jgi:DNA repair protein RadC
LDCGQPRLQITCDTVDDLKLIDCVEKLRTRLIEDVPTLSATLQQIRARDFRSVGADELRSTLVATTLKLPTTTAEDLRRLRREMDALLADADTPLRQDNPKLWEQLAKLLRAVDSDSPQPTFIQRLAACPNLLSAVQLAQQEFPMLTGRKVYQFLLAIGYPAATPSSETMRLLFRLGQVNTPELDAHSRRSYFETMQHISRVTQIPLNELDYMLGLYSGGHRVIGYKASCGPQPRCAECGITSACNYFKHNPPAARQSATIIPIKDWAHDERPRERYLAGERLSSAELLGIILRTGSGSRSAIDLGRELIHKFGNLHNLESASIAQICEIPGIGPAKAVEIKAAIELGRRIVQPAADTRDGLKSVASSRDVFDLFRPHFKAMTQEEFLLLALNTKNKIQRHFTISRGTLNSSIVHPRDVFKPALTEAAAGVIFVHNHPSGDPAPSPEDHALTRRLVEAGNILGIKVLDHVIVGSQRYYSFADEGTLG